jgi:hypothetical protein
MKYKLAVLFITGVLFSCSNKTNEKSIKNEIDGFYWAEITYISMNPPTKVSGIYIFSKNEMSIFYKKADDPIYAEHKAVFKSYIKDDFIYTCNCGFDDCLDKKTFGKDFRIISNVITDREQIVKLSNTIVEVTLTKDKGTGLDVKKW